MTTTDQTQFAKSFKLAFSYLEDANKELGDATKKVGEAFDDHRSMEGSLTVRVRIEENLGFALKKIEECTKISPLGVVKFEWGPGGEAINVTYLGEVDTRAMPVDTLQDSVKKGAKCLSLLSREEIQMSAQGDRSIAAWSLDRLWAKYWNIKGHASFTEGNVQEYEGNISKQYKYYDDAIQCLKKSLNFEFDGDTYYTLGLMYTDKNEKNLAIQAFEMFLKNTDREDEWSLDAEKMIDKLKAGVIGKKSFTGSWKILIGLGVFSLIGLFMITEGEIGAGFFNAILWGGLAALYYRWKYR